MTMTIDIPDAMYQELEQAAAQRHETLTELILERISEPAVLPPNAPELKPLMIPAIESRNPGSLKLGPEGVYEYISFP